MNKPSLVIVIVEDERHRMLIYRYLKICGVAFRQIRICLSPSGRGSAESWVRKTFVAETNAYRARPAQTALIVLIDADALTVQNRLNQLDRSLKQSGQPTVQIRDRIARLVPKRNVETWILCLNGHTVDEETDYKSRVRDWNGPTQTAAKNMNWLIRFPLELKDIHVDSLRRGITELRQLDL